MDRFIETCSTSASVPALSLSQRLSRSANRLRHFVIIGLAVASMRLLAAGVGSDLGTLTSLLDPSGLRVQLEGDRPQIAFSGVLQSAESPNGPWNDVPNATSPFLADPSSPVRFYRSRTLEEVFASDSVLGFEIQAPLQHHFELAFAGTPDGIFPPTRLKPYFDGQLTIWGQVIPVSLRVRGNSSLQECPFPKLKFKVSKKDREGTPFATAREIKIGTHCAEGGTGNIGRLRDERAAYREALAYEIMSDLGFVSPRIRRTRIDYHDTTSTNDNEFAGWHVTRNAMILEDVEVVAERLGGRALPDEEIAVLSAAQFDGQLVVDLQFLHALLGNWDWSLGTGDRGLWNTDVIQRADKTYLPLAGDFDLASWVTGFVRISVPRDYLPELPDRDRQVRFDLEQLQRGTSKERFTQGAARFTALKPQLEARVASAVIDDLGRVNASLHLTSFFAALQALAR